MSTAEEPTKLGKIYTYARTRPSVKAYKILHMASEIHREKGGNDCSYLYVLSRPEELLIHNFVGNWALLAHGLYTNDTYKHTAHVPWGYYKFLVVQKTQIKLRYHRDKEDRTCQRADQRFLESMEASEHVVSVTNMKGWVRGHVYHLGFKASELMKDCYVDFASLCAISKAMSSPPQEMSITFSTNPEVRYTFAAGSVMFVDIPIYKKGGETSLEHLGKPQAGEDYGVETDEDND